MDGIGMQEAVSPAVEDVRAELDCDKMKTVAKAKERTKQPNRREVSKYLRIKLTPDAVSLRQQHCRKAPHAQPK